MKTHEYQFYVLLLVILKSCPFIWTINWWETIFVVLITQIMLVRKNTKKGILIKENKNVVNDKKKNKYCFVDMWWGCCLLHVYCSFVDKNKK